MITFVCLGFGSVGGWCLWSAGRQGEQVSPFHLPLRQGQVKGRNRGGGQGEHGPQGGRGGGGARGATFPFDQGQVQLKINGSLA